MNVASKKIFLGGFNYDSIKIIAKNLLEIGKMLTSST